jgi:hypothetical protein
MTQRTFGYNFKSFFNPATLGLWELDISLYGNVSNLTMHVRILALFCQLFSERVDSTVAAR